MQKTIKPKMQILPKTLQLSNQDPNLQFLRSENLQIDLELKLDDALYCESVGITGFEVDRSKLLVFESKRQTLAKIGYRAFDISKCFKDTYTDGYPDPSKLFPKIKQLGSNLGHQCESDFELWVGGKRIETNQNFEQAFDCLNSFVGRKVSARNAYEKQCSSWFQNPHSDEWLNFGEELRKWKLEHDWKKPLMWGPLFPVGTGNGVKYSIDVEAYKEDCYMVLNGLRCKSTGTKFTW